MDIKKYQILYEEESLQSLEKIGLYYEEIGGEKLKIDILTRIYTQIESLHFMPERNQLTSFSDKVRYLVLRNLPYIAFYTLQNDKVYILEILHARKDYSSLKERYRNQ